MLQTVKLMALPLLDLQAAISAEIEANPALELVERDDTPDNLQTKDLDGADINYLEEDSDPGYTHSNSDKSVSEFIEGTQTNKESLIDHLINQLRLCKLTEEETLIGELLINNLDSNGFHITKIDDLFLDSQMKIVNKVIDIIHQLDPIGVCVNDIYESLIVQAKILGRYPYGTIEILSESMDLITKGKKKLIMEKYDLSIEDIEDIYDYLKTLNPHPTAEFTTGYSNYIIPEAHVTKEGKSINVYLKEENIPSLTINKEFEEYKETDNKDVNRFAKKSINSANSFIQAINMRNSTLLKTINSIVKNQKEFFLFGPGNIKPLTRKEIALETELSESTISRISSDKYIQTDWGIYNLKYFFSNAIVSSQSGRDHSKESVKEIVKNIIIENKSEKKLSDQQISNILKERGINLARRTVSKYRKELNLLSSYERQ
ncbi:RNA polymerase sigma-54 factor [Thiospirochaeta perfilievii]|uniref:RNA polymerase sigma-54 factor n=2 Tax=Thiospirochaeta perfilievii TaxID=252967 RepID=A0A5C1Q9U0_9SPIO|nr:RNA polymerase sigma-54 factor [Thiospirochaeta perfilievii]